MFIKKQEEKVMKKMLVLLALVSFAFVAYAADEMNYVIIDGKTYFSEEVKVGPGSVRIATDDGLTLKAPLKKVDALMVNGKVWERLPVVCCEGKAKGTALMEFVTQRNDLRLYKYHSDDCSLGCTFYDKSNQETMYFLYKEGKLYLRVTKENAQTVFAFFHIQFKDNA